MAKKLNCPITSPFRRLSDKCWRSKCALWVGDEHDGDCALKVIAMKLQGKCER